MSAYTCSSFVLLVSCSGLSTTLTCCQRQRQLLRFSKSGPPDPSQLNLLAWLRHSLLSLDWNIFLRCCLSPTHRCLRSSWPSRGNISFDSWVGYCHSCFVIILSLQRCCRRNPSFVLCCYRASGFHPSLFPSPSIRDSSISVLLVIRRLIFCAVKILHSFLSSSSTSIFDSSVFEFCCIGDSATARLFSICGLPLFLSRCRCLHFTSLFRV